MHAILNNPKFRSAQDMVNSAVIFHNTQYLLRTGFILLYVRSSFSVEKKEKQIDLNVAFNPAILFKSKKVSESKLRW